MRIVLVVHGYPPQDLGGTEVHAAAIARALVDRGHAVSVLTGTRRGGDGRRSVVDSVEDGVAVRRIGIAVGDARSGLTNHRVRAEFERLLDETTPAIVHIQHLLHLSGDLIEAAKDRSVPTVATLHDLWFQCPSIHPRPGDRHSPGRRWGVGCVWHHELRRPARIAAHLVRGELPRAIGAALRRPGFLRRQLDLTDILLAPSRFISDAFLRFGVSQEKLHLMPHAVQLVPTRSRPPTRPIRFGFVGSLVPTKGIHVLCEAFRRIEGDSTLHIYGPPYSARYLRRLRRYFGPNTRYEGEFSPEEAARVYGSFDVLVLPSLVPESFGLVALEAQACGLPVVASNLGALSERIRHERDGLLVSPGDAGALSRALSRMKDPAEVAHLAAQIRPPRSIASYIEELEGIYVRLACGSSNSSESDRPVASKMG